MELKERYFYTTHTPHAWSSGPRIHWFDLSTHGYIATLERARELALEHEKLTGDESRTEVSWGVSFEKDQDYNGNPNG